MTHRHPTAKTCRKSAMFETRLCVAGIAFTLVATAMVGLDLWRAIGEVAAAGDTSGLLSHLVFGMIIGFLVYGSFVYLTTRWAYYSRLAHHQQTPEEQLARCFIDAAPTLTVLVPSYKEEEKVIFQTLFSAALQHYPKKRVALLIDDPPAPTSTADKHALDTTRALPQKLSALLRPMQILTAQAQRELQAADFSTPTGRANAQAAATEVFRQVLAWFSAQMTTYRISDHADQAFIEKVLAAHIEILNRCHAASAEALAHANDTDAKNILATELARLVGIFDVEITSFERKRFENLSHEPNNAMNLNSYIALMGKSFAVATGRGARQLVEVSADKASLSVSHADYVLTLDADSILVPDYAQRLIYVMEQPGQERLAVIQTPYSAFPGATKPLERIAGATTDIQYIIHQGFTAFNGTYWVGANALIRRRALDDIVLLEQERGFTVSRYIQDRTVIEDTESSVDLIARGWQLYNYPERLAYSATPPDFGALVIQRRRWANGGLIILPKLLRYLLKGPLTLGKLAEAFVRIHYLTSIAAVNVGLLLALAVPLATYVTTLWLPLTAAAYFALYARDLKLIGYRHRDLFGVYAVNLLLIPVNLAGVVKSLQQGWTGAKIPFGRTPKVGGRTATAPWFIIALGALVINWTVAASLDVHDGLWSHATFAAANMIVLAYAMHRFIGWRECIEDVVVGLQPAMSLLGVRFKWLGLRSQARVRRLIVPVISQIAPGHAATLLVRDANRKIRAAGAANDEQRDAA